jgi:hypothetical protein
MIFLVLFSETSQKENMNEINVSVILDRVASCLRRVNNFDWNEKLFMYKLWKNEVNKNLIRKRFASYYWDYLNEPFVPLPFVCLK